MAQSNPLALYEPFKFEDYTPKWKHIVFDTTIVGRVFLSGEDTLYYDGWSHFFSGFDDYTTVINDSNLFIVTDLSNFFEGAYIEKIDIKTGKVLWNDNFDKRNMQRRELPIYASMYSENLEIIGYKQLYNEFPKPPGSLWLRGILSKRIYNTDDGELQETFFADENDSLTKLLFIPLEISKGTSKYLFPFLEGYQFIKHFPLLNLKNIDFNISYLDKNSYVNYDTLVSTPYTFPKLEYVKLFKINNDTIIGVIHSDKDDQSKTDSFELKFYLFDRLFNIIDSFNLENTIPAAFTYRIVHTSNSSFIIEGIDEINNTKVAFFSSIDYKGNLLETVYLKNDDNIPFPREKSAKLKLKYESGMLFITVDKKNGSWYLNIYKSDGNGTFLLLKSLKITPNNHKIEPMKLFQINSGDIILKCIDRNYNYSDRMNSPIAITWICFSAEDLGLQGTSTRDLTGQYNKLSLLPNPAKDILKIQSDHININKIKMYDMLGRLVMDKNVPNENTYTVNVASLLPGIYSVKAIGKEKYAESAIFVKE